MNQRPNILLIQVDQWRADCFSSENHPVVHTPFIDQLAARGVFFRKAYVGVPTCIASRVSLMTGLKQKTHGRFGYEDGVIWNYSHTLAGEFSNNGYQTQAVGKMHVYPERNRIGFQNVILHDGFLHYSRNSDYELKDDYISWLREKVNYTADYFDHGVSCNSYVARPWDKEEYLHPTNFVTSQAIDFLRRRDVCSPFFLYVSYHRPHPPYDPPAWAFEQYIHREIPMPLVGEWSAKFENLRTPFDPVAVYDKVSPAVLHRAMAGYYGHMTHIDHQINRLVETLRQYNVHQNTYILFVSDHGELMGDHHFFRKSYPFEGSARVPLLLSTASHDLRTLKRNKKSHTLIEMRDVMPTLLDLANLPLPSCVEGKSFLNSATQNNDEEINDYLHGEHVLSSSDSVHAIYTQRYKYIWLCRDGKELLFDLKNDPHEIHDLSNVTELQTVRQQLRELLVKELTGRSEGFVVGNQLVTGRAPIITAERPKKN